MNSEDAAVIARLMAEGNEKPKGRVQNVSILKKDNILTLMIDLNQDFGSSGSGKSTIIASTRGNIPLADAPGVYLSLNIYKKL